MTSDGVENRTRSSRQNKRESNEEADYRTVKSAGNIVACDKRDWLRFDAIYTRADIPAYGHGAGDANSETGDCGDISYPGAWHAAPGEYCNTFAYADQAADGDASGGDSNADPGNRANVLAVAEDEAETVTRLPAG